MISLAKHNWKSAIRGAFSRLRRDNRGNILVIFGFALPLLIGALGLAVDGATWYETKRSLQNAADQAAVAAATNATSTYADEAKSVAARYGFTDGQANVVVTPLEDQDCPDAVGGSDCWKVTITKDVPLLFTQVVGFVGNINGSSGLERLSAIAYANRDKGPREYCILALATKGNAVSFLSNGGPKADLSGCNLMSNTGMTCNGHDLNADYGDAAGVNNGCGNAQTSNVDPVTDPYADRADNIPADPCKGSYPTNYPASNQLSGTYTDLGSDDTPKTYCGDVKLTNDVVLKGTNIMVIYNGQLNTNGKTIKTDTGAAATIIFSGTTSSTSTHAPTGGGTVDIAGPKTGDWHGVAMYQDPKLTTGVDITYSGNKPTWNLTGLVYLPHSSVTFSGIVNKSANGGSCFVLVVDNITINGTGKIMTHGGCKEAGLIMPDSPLGAPIRGRLVG